MSRVLILLTGIVFIFYWRSLFTFFQGDEWYYFTLILPYTHFWYGPFSFLYKSLADIALFSSGAHLTPVSNLLYFLSVKFFTFNYWPYALSGIILHILNSFILFIFVKNFTKKKNVAVLSSIFFAASAIHQQAVTWVMTYLWTELSTGFFLLSLIFFLKALSDKKIQKNIFYSCVFALLALLTKESTVILLPLVVLLLILKGKISSWRIYLKTYTVVFVFYAVFRFFLPKFFVWVNNFIGEKAIQAAPLDLGLIVFRIITYPLKTLAEVFVPAEWIRSWAEFLTPFAYPQYSDDMKILGRNYAVFTQTAGSDSLIFFISAIILLLIIFSIYRIKNRDNKKTIIFSLAIIVLSAFPLLLIATYAPWWAYVTFIDSRHLYITSVGASIIFAFAITSVSEKLSSRIKLSSFSVILILLFIWGIFQYFLVQQELDKALITANQRKTVLNKILKTVPSNKDKKVIFVESNQGYYGFINMPPFQTNLGQILAVNYFQKENLPQFFINSDFITKGGIRGEGYAENRGKGFGYFLNRKTITEEIIKDKVSIDDVYAFNWDGKTNTISDQTKDFRNKVSLQKSTALETSKWNTFSDDVNKFSLKYPTSMQLVVNSSSDNLKDIELISNDLNMRIILKKKPQEVGLSEYVKKYLLDSDGKLVGSDFTYRDIYPINRFGDLEEFITSIYPTTGKYPKYFYPGKTAETFFEIFVTGGNHINYVSLGIGRYHKDVEDIISTISFDDLQ